MWPEGCTGGPYGKDEPMKDWLLRLEFGVLLVVVVGMLIVTVWSVITSVSS